MRVIITGVKGFIGKELSVRCGKLGIEVTGLDIIDCKESNYCRIDINSKDVMDVIPENCDAVIHLAALSRDKDCKDNAVNCFHGNVMGTLNLVEAAQKRNVKNFVFASTEWVYDKFAEKEVKDEDSIIDASNLKSEYALSKLVSEINLRQKYLHGFGNITILRFGIIYGPRPSEWSAVEALFNDVYTKDAVVVGSLRTGRCFIHVSDIVNGIIKSIGLNGFNLINLQSDRFIDLGEIIDLSRKILNKNPEVIEKSAENASIRNISNRKAKAVLGWKPEYDIESGLKSLRPILPAK